MRDPTPAEVARAIRLTRWIGWPLVLAGAALTFSGTVLTWPGLAAVLGGGWLLCSGEFGSSRQRRCLCGDVEANHDADDPHPCHAPGCHCTSLILRPGGIRGLVP
jgi:hypothetical protein